MIIHELVQAVQLERASDIAQLQLEHEARELRRSETATRDAPPKTSWLRVPSFVTHILRPASAR